MRTLERNKTTLWYVNPSDATMIDVIDEDGYFTGEKEMVYGVPKEIRLHLYPATGDIVERVFGKNVDIDMVTTSNEILSQDSMIFYKLPLGNFDTTFDFKIKFILKSLNSYQYGLKGRR